ncbi:hypothetical protein [Candidatus Avelusimicrobium gallicola]|uniref:Uncharacterized protein n=1 Tax=Candidatus Avelusimicrobium gallicola TaxID=2562704 RepID=A0A1Y4DCX5_9BACT|nr:hypothetical protein [Elusimicrobium sp. An273]OUO56967.1 hypothetical protein B5F75_03730 [Elusimicrobium sp. An273]
MKLNKFFALLATLAVSTAAFAGNSSSNSALIEQSVSSAAATVEEEAADPQILKNTQQALTMGFMIFDAHRDLNSMTETDQAIASLLESNIPATLNKIETSSDDVVDEIEPMIEQLTDLLLKNQTVYPAASYDRQAGVYITFLTAIMYANQKGLLLGKVSNILSAEIQSSFAE